MSRGTWHSVREARIDSACSIAGEMGNETHVEWEFGSSSQAVTVNTQMLHCSQEALGSEGKYLSAEELKNHSVHLRIGPSKAQRVKDLVVPFCRENSVVPEQCPSCWARTPSKAAVWALPSKWDPWRKPSIHPQDCRKPPKQLLLEAEKYS